MRCYLFCTLYQLTFGKCLLKTYIFNIKYKYENNPIPRAPITFPKSNNKKNKNKFNTSNKK